MITTQQYHAGHCLAELARLEELEPILRAVAEGAQVQHLDSDGRWKDSICSFVNTADRYRIKPKPVKFKRRHFVFRDDDRELRLGTIVEGQKNAWPQGVETAHNFVCWIDKDWVTVEVELS